MIILFIYVCDPWLDVTKSNRPLALILTNRSYNKSVLSKKLDSWKKTLTLFIVLLVLQIHESPLQLLHKEGSVRI